jgi:hypothetical protein
VQEREVRPVGSARTFPVDIRVVGASKRLGLVAARTQNLAKRPQPRLEHDAFRIERLDQESQALVLVPQLARRGRPIGEGPARPALPDVGFRVLATQAAVSALRVNHRASLPETGEPHGPADLPSWSKSRAASPRPGAGLARVS